MCVKKAVAAVVTSNMIERFIICYLLVINTLTFIVICWDKQKACKFAWRISESTLFTLAISGGSVGEILGMVLCRHKTKQFKFVIGIPTILIIQGVIAYYIYFSAIIH